MQRTRLNRILSIVLSLSVVIGITSISRETVLADTDPTSGLTYTITDGAASITGFTAPTGFDGTLDIPDTLGGASVKSIGDLAFNSCTSLTGITIPNSVTSIGNYAFNSCKSLSSITIPSSVTSIGDCAFYFCTSLISIIVDMANTVYKSVDGILFSKEGTVLICCPGGRYGSIEILSGVTSIEDHAFHGCSSLTGITIPSSVTSIGDCAFYYCPSLASITIPSGVSIIGDNAFSQCYSLTSITVAAANTMYKSVNGIILSKDGTKLICCPGGKSGSITIPSGVTNIGSDGFYACSRLTGITIPGSVTNIDSWAFWHCTSLTSISIPSSVTSIGGWAFYECENLACVTIQGAVTSINDNAFSIGSGKQIKFFVSTDKITYYQSLLKANVMGSTTAVVTDKYTVTFDANGGIAGAGSDYTQQIPIDGLASAPANPPARTGYVFNGWYKEAACTNIWDSSSNVVTNDMTLYAMWIQIPTTPTNLKAVSAGYNSAKLTWTAVAGATGYSIYRSTSPASGFAYIKAVTSTGYTNTGLTTGTTYYYQIKAYTLVDATKIYSAATGTVSAKPIQAAPTGLKAVSAGYNSNKLTWTAVAGATGYSIYRSTSPTSGFTYIKAVTSASYTNTGLTTGTPYYYQIKAYTLVGTTKIYSAFTSVVSAKPIPATPTGLTAARASDTSIKISWNAVTGATGYALYRSTLPTSGFTYIKSVTSASYTNTGLTTGTTYYYQIKAYTMVGSTKVYSIATAAAGAKP